MRLFFCGVGEGGGKSIYVSWITPNMIFEIEILCRVGHDPRRKRLISGGDPDSFVDS